MTTEKAIGDIIVLNTLPPQIDYTKSYQIKANEAQLFLDSLPKEKREAAENNIAEQIRQYYGPDGAAQYDLLF